MKWEEICGIVEEVLTESGGSCFLTAYQIAVLFVEKNSKRANPINITLDTGGAKIGKHTGIAQQIAGHLSRIYKNAQSCAPLDSSFKNRLEQQFLSTQGLDVANGLADFGFNGGYKPSSDEFSMFRLKN